MKEEEKIQQRGTLCTEILIVGEVQFNLERTNEQREKSKFIYPCPS